jgi:hypothetical protein
MEENSMLYWWPKIEKLKIPKPKSTIILLNDEEKEKYQELDEVGFLSDRLVQEVTKAADSFGYPVFIRTDHYSGKHSWERTCFVPSREEIKQHLFELGGDSLCAGLFGIPVNAFVVREYIQMDELFKAFHGKMPINPEIRFFVKDKKIICSHWYWIWEAIQKGTHQNLLPPDWRQRLENGRASITEEEKELLDKHALSVADHIEGAWSVDFCRAKNKAWYLIDMANAAESWHQDGCNKIGILNKRGE